MADIDGVATADSQDAGLPQAAKGGLQVARNQEFPFPFRNDLRVGAFGFEKQDVANQYFLILVSVFEKNERPGRALLYTLQGRLRAGARNVSREASSMGGTPPVRSAPVLPLYMLLSSAGKDIPSI
jgi:hypothetical protein